MEAVANIVDQTGKLIKDRHQHLEQIDIALLVTFSFNSYLLSTKEAREERSSKGPRFKTLSS